MICHMDFDPSYENTEGKRYFTGVYVPNRTEEMFSFDNNKPIEDQVDPETYPSQNLYDYIINRGFSMSMGKGSGVTCLRTGYDPAKQRKNFEA